MPSQPFAPAAARYALALRVGLGLVFVIAGGNKLAQLLDPARSDAILATYLGPLGYINAFFAEFLFTGASGSCSRRGCSLLPSRPSSW